MPVIRFMLSLLVFLAIVPARADDRCLGPVAQRNAAIIPAAFQLAQQQRGVHLTFIGHATFLLESPGGIAVATDYNDYIRPDRLPAIVTMNRAHSTHYTLRPDPGIAHLLRGWSEAPGPVHHDMSVGDVRVRNVATNIRNGPDQTEYYGNSIFVFHIAGLCIAHLGHLHHTLSPRHLQALGPIDVVLVPVDGSWTLNIDGMIDVLRQINAPVMIPMHYFGESSLQRFLQKAAQSFPVSRLPGSTWMAHRSALPDTPSIFVLAPEK